MLLLHTSIYVNYACGPDACSVLWPTYPFDSKVSHWLCLRRMSIWAVEVLFNLRLSTLLQMERLENKDDVDVVSNCVSCAPFMSVDSFGRQDGGKEE